MTKSYFIDILAQGSAAWNDWRGRNPERVIDLRGLDLSEMYIIDPHYSGATPGRIALRNVNLSGADLRGANMVGWNLQNADLSRSDIRDANLSYANLENADFSEADLRGAVLNHASLVKTGFVKADLRSASVYGASVWNVQLEGCDQSGLIITPKHEPIITVDELEVAQFIYLLLKHDSLRSVINAVTEKGVLILGRFSDGGLDILQSIAGKLRESKYLPIIFDFDRPTDRNYTEVVKTLAGLSRFVVVDLSGPSVPQELYATVPHFKIPFVLIIEKGKKPYSMVRDILEYDWVLKPVIEYRNMGQLSELIMSKIITSVEEKISLRRESMRGL